MILSAGNGTTSYSENIGAIGITKVGLHLQLFTICLQSVTHKIHLERAMAIILPNPCARPSINKHRCPMNNVA